MMMKKTTKKFHNNFSNIVEINAFGIALSLLNYENKFLIAMKIVIFAFKRLQTEYFKQESQIFISSSIRELARSSKFVRH